MFLVFSNSLGSITLESIIWPIFAGIVIAAIIALYNKHVTGRFVMKLISEKALDGSTARSLKELGFEKNHAVRLALRSNELYNKIVHHEIPNGSSAAAANGDIISAAPKDIKGKKSKKSSADEKYDIDKAVFFVPSEHIDRAKLLYSRNGAPILLVFVAMLIFCLAIAALFYVMPYLSKMLGNLTDKISSFKS